MAGVAQQSKLGFFQSPGLCYVDLGEPVSQEERRAAQAQAEMEAIYGSSNQADGTQVLLQLTKFHVPPAIKCR